MKEFLGTFDERVGKKVEGGGDKEEGSQKGGEIRGGKSGVKRIRERTPELPAGWLVGGKKKGGDLGRIEKKKRWEDCLRFK